MIYHETEHGTLYCGDCMDILPTLADKSIDLTVTSPPYDNLREYKGYSFDFEAIAKELLRITKDGGVVVWVVGDATINGSETGTSFKQALFFKEIGFNLHDTMIYQKNCYPFPPSNRYFGVFEYMFVLSVGNPKTTNLKKVKTIGKKHTQSTSRQADGSIEAMKYEFGKDERVKDNVWKYDVGYGKSSNDKRQFEHPARYSPYGFHLIAYTELICKRQVKYQARDLRCKYTAISQPKSGAFICIYTYHSQGLSY